MAEKPNNQHQEPLTDLTREDMRELARDYLTFNEPTKEELDSGELGKVTQEELKALNKKFKDKYEKIKFGTIYEYKSLLKSTMEYKLFTSTVSQFESTNSLKEEEIKLLQRKFGLDEDGKIGLSTFSTFLLYGDYFTLNEFLDNHIRLIENETTLFDTINEIPGGDFKLNRKKLIDKVRNDDVLLLQGDIVKFSNDFSKFTIIRGGHNIHEDDFSSDFNSFIYEVLEDAEKNQPLAVANLEKKLESLPDYNSKIQHLRQLLSSLGASELRRIFTVNHNGKIRLNFGNYDPFNKIISANHLFSDMNRITDGKKLYEYSEKGFTLVGTGARLSVRNGDYFFEYYNQNQDLIEANEINFEDEFGEFIDYIGVALDISPKTIRALMTVESTKDIHKKNSGGAQGIMQLTSNPFNDMALILRNGELRGRGVNTYLDKFKNVFGNPDMLNKIGDSRAKQAIGDIMAMTNFDQKEFTRNINILKRIIKTEHSIPDPYLNIAIGSIYYSLQKTKFDKNDEKLVEKIVSQIKSGDLDFDKFNKFLSDKNYETVSKESFDEMLNELLKPENGDLRKNFYASLKYNGDAQTGHSFNDMPFMNIYALKVYVIEQLEVA